MPPGRNPETRVPVAGPPSAFPGYMDAQRQGEFLPQYLDTKVPVYEQERFERKIYRMFATVTGTGAAIFTFTITPINNKPTRVNRVYMDSTDATIRQITIQKAFIFGSTVRTVDLGVTRVPAGFGTMLVGEVIPTRNDSVTNQMTVDSQVLLPARFQPVKPADAQPDSLIIKTDSAPSAAAVIQVYVECEEVPPYAQFSQNTEELLVSAV